MSKSEKPNPEPAEHDRVWDLLADQPEVEAQPYFAKQVARAAAQTPRGSFLYRWLFGPRARRVLVPATACAALLIAVSVAIRPAPAPAVVVDAPPSPEAVELPALAFQAAAVDYVDYFDQIVASETPALLSDADIVDLLIDDGSSALLF